jgi:hypothetical protein
MRKLENEKWNDIGDGILRNGKSKLKLRQNIRMSMN